MNWQPIKQAPQSTKILLWVGNAFGHNHVKTGLVNEEGIFSMYDDGECLGMLKEEYATHFMLLPEPPKS